MEWKNSGDTGSNEYCFLYDFAGRVIQAMHTKHDSDEPYYFDEQVSYDLNGNILSMIRRGVPDAGLWGATDSLHYTYTGNKLKRISDDVEGPNNNTAFHFYDGANETEEYEYDRNGNMTKDLNKNISSIEYNSLNLPTKISMGTNITYEYTSDGEKMKAKYPSIVIWPVNHLNGGRGDMADDNSAGDEQLRLPPLNPHLEITYDSLEYRGSFIFRKGGLEQVLFDGGNITVDSLGTPHYHYYVCDHLGSVRAVVGETGTVEHQYGYYPFGALHSIGKMSANRNIQKEQIESLVKKISSY